MAAGPTATHGAGPGGKANATKTTTTTRTICRYDGTLDPPDKPAADQTDDDTKKDDCFIQNSPLVLSIAPIKIMAPLLRRTRATSVNSRACFSPDIRFAPPRPLPGREYLFEYAVTISFLQLAS